MIDDRIKAFNKKVANGKADTQIILGHHQDGVEAQIKSALDTISHLQGLLQKQVDEQGKQPTTESGIFS